MDGCLIGFDFPGIEMPPAESRYSMWGLQGKKHDIVKPLWDLSICYVISASCILCLYWHAYKLKSAINTSYGGIVRLPRG